MTLTELNGQKFNLPALLKVAEQAQRNAYCGSDRNVIGVFVELVKCLIAERSASTSKGEHP